jgi:histidinol-phosphate/aromatic aminotransferase/cobyric acid decarboxylase-like protein
VARKSIALLVDGLGRLGLECLPTRTNYWLVRVGDGAGLRRELLRRGLLVRDCASFGLPEYVRIAGRPVEESERLLATVTRLVQSGLVSSAPMAMERNGERGRE